MRLIATIWLDVRVQARSHLYAFGIAVAVLLGSLLSAGVPEPYLAAGFTCHCILVVGSTTYMFGASILLFEKREGTLEALRVSQLRTPEYLLSKVVTLAGFAWLESIITGALMLPWASVNWIYLSLGVWVLGAFYTLVGVGLAAHYASVNQFLFPVGAGVAMVLQLSVLSLLEVSPIWLWYGIPTQAPLLLIEAAGHQLKPWQWWYASLGSLGIVAAAWQFCRLQFRSQIGLSDE